jgi:hypothetical protein
MKRGDGLAETPPIPPLARLLFMRMAPPPLATQEIAMTHHPIRLFALVATASSLFALLPACSDGAQARTAEPTESARPRPETFHSQYPAPTGEVQALPAQF